MKNINNISKMSPQVYIATLDIPDLSPSPVEIYGIDPRTDFTVQPWLQRPLDHPLNSGEVIVGNVLSTELSSQIILKNRSYEVAGILDLTQSSVDHTIFLGLDDAYGLAAEGDVISGSDPTISPGDINAVMVQVEQGADPDMVSSRIRQPSSSITVIQKHFTLDPVSRDVQGLPAILTMILAVVIFAAFSLIALISGMVAKERQREIGLFMSMGAKRNIIFSFIVGESLILAAIGGIAGVCVSLAAFFLLNAQGLLTNALQVSFRMPSEAEIGQITAITLIIVIVIGALASLLPAYSSSTMNPYDAIRSES